MSNQQHSLINPVSTPLLSIGLPVYNGAKYIRETLESILSQSFVDYELLISDNCSNDDTELICKEFAQKDFRIKYFRQPKNLGPINNFYFVLEESRGLYFMWSAADDLITPETHLEVLINDFDHGIDYVFPNVNIIKNHAGKLIRENSELQEFAKSTSHFEFCMTTVRNNAYQLYSIFNKSALLSQIDSLKACHYMKCFNEGLFVHSLSANLNGRFQPSVFKVFRRHSENISSKTPFHLQLRDFASFTLKAIRLWLKTTSVNAQQRILIICRILKVHLTYAFVMTYYLLKSCINNNR